MTNASLYRCARCASTYAIPYVQAGHAPLAAPLACHALYLDTAQQPRTCGGELEPFTPVPASQEAPSA